MIELILLCALASAAWAIGRLALRQLMGGQSIPGETAFSIAIGLGVFSLFTLALGLMGILYRWVLFFLLGSALLLIPLMFTRKWGATLSLSAFPTWVRRIREVSPLYAIIAGILLVELLSALAPPIEPDALSLHLLRAKYILERHRIDFSTSHFHFQFPGFMVCLYTFGMGLYSDRMAQLIHLLTMVMGLMGLYTFARRKGGESLTCLSGLFFLCIPIVNYHASTGLVDVGLAGYEILALIALLYWTETEDNAWIVLSGAMTGFALAIKYTGLFAFVLNISVVLYIGLRKRSRKILPRAGSALVGSLVFYILPAFLIPSFWYIKNLIKFSNPIYPLLPEVFSFFGLTPAFEPSYESWKIILASYGVERNFKNFLILPWIVTMPAYKIPLESGPIPIFYLALLPGLLLVRNIPGWVKTILAYCGAYLVLWFFFGTHQGRFIITPLALLSLPAAFAALTLMRGRKAIKIATLLVIILSVGISLGVLAYKKGMSALTGAGVISPRHYLEMTIRSFPVVQYILNNVPKAKVLIYRDNQTEYYLGRRYLACGQENPLPLCNSDWNNMDPEDMKKRLAEIGVTHILINENPMSMVRRKQKMIPEERIRRAMEAKLRRISSRRVFSSQGVSLYTVEQ